MRKAVVKMCGMKLKEWAREQGVSYRTALNWFHAGILLVSARQLSTGTIGKRGISLDATITEIGSGLSGRRVQVRKLLADPMVTRIVVEHRDRQPDRPEPG